MYIKKYEYYSEVLGDVEEAANPDVNVESILQRYEKSLSYLLRQYLLYQPQGKPTVPLPGVEPID